MGQLHQGAAMVDFLDIAKIIRRDDAAGPALAIQFHPRGLDTPDDPEMQEQPVEPARKPGKWLERDDDDIWGASFAIEYVDSAGVTSQRRVSCRACGTGPNGARYLQAFCHERKAIRSFRLDRIISVIDLDGEIHEPRAFFEKTLRVQFAATDPLQLADARPKRARGRPRSLVRNEIAGDGVRALIALGHADGHLSEAELDVVRGYVARKTGTSGKPATDLELGEIVDQAKRYYSTHEELIGCLKGISAQPPEQRRLFLRSAMALMAADGLQHPAEFEMLVEIENHLLPRV
jgi:WYL domain/Tellurite resistance protein TerB